MRMFDTRKPHIGMWSMMQICVMFVRELAIFVWRRISCNQEYFGVKSQKAQPDWKS